MNSFVLPFFSPSQLGGYPGQVRERTRKWAGTWLTASQLLVESKSNLGLSISYYVTPILGGLLALPGVSAPTVCACAFNFVHFSHCLLFLQLSFDVVCQVEEERDGICGAGCCGGGSTAAKDKSKNLLCRSGRGVVRWLAGRQAGRCAGSFIILPLVQKFATQTPSQFTVLQR